MESWLYGIGLIVFMIIFHAAGAAFIALIQHDAQLRLEKREAKLHHALRN